MTERVEEFIKNSKSTRPGYINQNQDTLQMILEFFANVMEINYVEVVELARRTVGKNLNIGKLLTQILYNI